MENKQPSQAISQTDDDRSCHDNSDADVVIEQKHLEEFRLKYLFFRCLRGKNS